jgi:hypothetical protein
MTMNFPGPYEVRFKYDVNIGGKVLTHQARFSLVIPVAPDPGDPFSGIDVELSGGGSDNLADIVVDTWNVLKPFMDDTGAECTVVELWKYTAGTFNADYITTYALNSHGSDEGASVAASEHIWTFRTTGGGIFKVTLLETNYGWGVSTPYGSASADNQAVMDYFSHATLAPYVARDNTYPFVPLYVHPGQNEAVFKKRYRL